MNKIIVKKQGNSWVAEFRGPHAAEIEELFGTSELPTPFTAAAPAENVLAEIRQKNPGVDVSAA